MNDLIGLKRAWSALPGDGSGMVDCCALAAEVHKRLGYYDYTNELLEIFSKYTDDSLPKSFIAKWLLKNAERIDGPEPHAVVLLPGNGAGAVGTVLDDGNVLFIAPNSYVVRAPIPEGMGWYFRMKK
jgi:hypothetical protein